MTGRNETNLPACERARGRMHAILDGGLRDVTVRQQLDDHLATCAACRTRWEELSVLQRSLQALPTEPLPDDALAEVFARTKRMQPGRTTWLDWRLAAAAVLVLALAGVWSLRQDPAMPPVDTPVAQYTEEERDQAIREARLALKLAAEALDRAQQAGVRRVEEVLSEEVSPALEKVPVRLPGARPTAGDSHT